MASKRIAIGSENMLKTFSCLLAGFSENLRNDFAAQSKKDKFALASITGVITGFIDAKNTWQERQKALAESFNILEVLKLTGNELRHSMVLAWLLDKDIDRHGTHAQGALGFQLFLCEIGLPVTYSKAKYWVRREVAGDESRVDIEISARDTFLIHIEVKIWSDEGVNQTARELSDLKKRAAALNIPFDHIHCIFLTPNGRNADHKEFKTLSWFRIEKTLEYFAESAIPMDVKLFARHYARALRVAGISQTQETDVNNDK